MEFLFIATATVLGALAFFEPCTIATHTLFAARLEKQQIQTCCARLLSIWITRTFLIVSLFTTAVALTSSPQWGDYLPSILLAVMASIYIISRFTYIPVPHLEFYRLIPGGSKLTQAIQLGLTLPACTIPLFIVVTGLAITLDSMIMAIVGGFLFASLFTLPLVITSIKGLGEDSIQLINRAAQATPYVTAFLLYSAAILLLLPEFDIKNFKQVLTEASVLGIALGFLAGLFFSFNPVSFASIPVILAYVSHAGQQKKSFQLGLAFVVGMIITHVSLGVVASIGGDWVKQLLGREWGLVLGPFLIVLGLLWSGWLKLRLPWIGMRAKKVSGPWGAFLLGVPFSVAVCPFCTPALLVALTASASIGSVYFGFGLLFAFSLGRSIPIILGSWSIAWLESLNIFTRNQGKVETFAGVMLILTGVYLLYEYSYLLRVPM